MHRSKIYSAMLGRCTKSVFVASFKYINFQALVAFRMDGKIPLPEIQFDSERVRYEHRLLPFSSLLTPPPVHYQEFLDMTNAQMHKRNVS